MKKLLNALDLAISFIQYFLLKIDVAEFETFKSFTVLNKALLVSLFYLNF